MIFTVFELNFEYMYGRVSGHLPKKLHHFIFLKTFFCFKMFSLRF